MKVTLPAVPAASGFPPNGSFAFASSPQLPGPPAKSRPQAPWRAAGLLPSSPCVFGITYRSSYFAIASSLNMWSISAGSMPTAAAIFPSGSPPRFRSRTKPRIAASRFSASRTGSGSPAVSRFAR